MGFGLGLIFASLLFLLAGGRRDISPVELELMAKKMGMVWPQEARVFTGDSGPETPASGSAGSSGKK